MFLVNYFLNCFIDKADSLLSGLENIIGELKAEILALRGQVGKLKLDNKELLNTNIKLSTKIGEIEAIFAVNKALAISSSR